jgi:hypothetical protein
MEELERFVGIVGRPPPPVCGSVMVNVGDSTSLLDRAIYIPDVRSLERSRFENTVSSRNSFKD